MYIAQDLPRYFVRRFLRVRATSDGDVHVWRSSFYCTGVFSFARYRKDLVSLLWIRTYVMESYPYLVPPIQSKFLAMNLSSLTRWCSCFYDLILRAADGAGFLVRCMPTCTANCREMRSVNWFIVCWNIILLYLIEFTFFSFHFNFLTLFSG